MCLSSSPCPYGCKEAEARSRDCSRMNSGEQVAVPAEHYLAVAARHQSLPVNSFPVSPDELFQICLWTSTLCCAWPRGHTRHHKLLLQLFNLHGGFRGTRFILFIFQCSWWCCCQLPFQLQPQQLQQPDVSASGCSPLPNHSSRTKDLSRHNCPLLISVQNNLSCFF